MEFTMKPDGSPVPKDGDARKAQTPAGPAEGPGDQSPAAGSILSADEPAPKTGGRFLASPDEAPQAAAGDVVKDSNTANFAADVIEASVKVPVIVDFWAPWCGPCKQLGPMLEKLVRETAGLVRLVKINIDENQDLATQMRIQSIPAVYAFKNGQPVDGFTGALPESQLKTFIGKLTGDIKSPIEIALEEAAKALATGDAATAGAIFAKVQSQDPANAEAIAGMIRAALAGGDQAGARAMIEGLPDEVAQKPDVAAAISAVELSEQGQESGDVEELRSRLEADENDHRARFDLAMALYGQGRNDEAVEGFLDLVRRQLQWEDEAARKQLLKIFEALGPADPLTLSGRRRLSSILFS